MMSTTNMIMAMHKMQVLMIMVMRLVMITTTEKLKINTTHTTMITVEITPKPRRLRIRSDTANQRLTLPHQRSPPWKRLEVNLLKLGIRVSSQGRPWHLMPRRRNKLIKMLQMDLTISSKHAKQTQAIEDLPLLTPSNATMEPCTWK